jgi:hypothetical protein
MSPTRVDSPADNNYAMSIMMHNRGSVAVFIGGADVTAATGYQLDPAGRMRMDLRNTDGGVYGITASGTAEVHRLQLGVS